MQSRRPTPELSLALRRECRVPSDPRKSVHRRGPQPSLVVVPGGRLTTATASILCSDRLSRRICRLVAAASGSSVCREKEASGARRPEVLAIASLGRLGRPKIAHC